MDGLSNTICLIFSQLSYAITNSASGYNYLDFSNPVVLTILCIVYIITVYLICKLVVGVIRWFYRL